MIEQYATFVNSLLDNPVRHSLLRARLPIVTPHKQLAKIPSAQYCAKGYRIYSYPLQCLPKAIRSELYAGCYYFDIQSAGLNILADLSGNEQLKSYLKSGIWFHFNVSPELIKIPIYSLITSGELKGSDDQDLIKYLNQHPATAAIRSAIVSLNVSPKTLAAMIAEQESILMFIALQLINEPILTVIHDGVIIKTDKPKIICETLSQVIPFSYELI